jgi:L-ascorbate metabolism protein UlaG (beta-lactamase superfamily)
MIKKAFAIFPVLIAGVTVALTLSCNPNTDSQKADEDISVLLEYSVPSWRLDNAPPNFFGRPDEYLEWEAAGLLHLVEETLHRFPPGVSEPIVRHMAIHMLDAVFHDVNAPHRPAVQEFHHRRAALALEEMQRTGVDEGAMIWKLYNMGFVVRTSTVTIGFDLTSGYTSRSDDFALTDDIMKAIVEQCDVLFISHFHRDHAEESVARAFLDLNKPVIAPAQIWAGLPIHDEITHLGRSAHKPHLLPVKSGEHELQVIVYPGHQGSQIQNNVTLVITPEGLSFCHTGDQSFSDDFEWIDQVSEHFKVDVLMPNCWTTDPPRASRGYDPRLIIPGHENELGHSIDHREAYALNYSRWDVPYPKIMMTWGESYHYKP